MKDRYEAGEADPQLMKTLAVIGVVLLALGVGLMGGYVIFGRHGEAPTAMAPGGVPQPGASAPVTGSQPVAGQPAALPAVCPFELPAKDLPSLAGLTCNCGQEHCNNLKLLNCHCETAHAMKTYVKELLAKGMKPDPRTIGAELEKRWGKGITPSP